MCSIWFILFTCYLIPYVAFMHPDFSYVSMCSYVVYFVHHSHIYLTAWFLIGFPIWPLSIWLFLCFYVSYVVYFYIAGLFLHYSLTTISSEFKF